MASETIIKELLERYKHGDCTPEEVALLEAWFEKVQQETEFSPSPTPVEEDRLVQALRADPRFREAAPVVQHPARTGVFRRFIQIPAAVWIGILLTLGGLTTWYVFRNSQLRKQVPLAFREINTTFGERKKIVLPDSSVVWLNSRSTLAWHPDFTRHRQVLLKGEAFFEVSHDKEHPFTVQAGQLLTKVYGTAFNIQAFEKDHEQRVALQRGSIGIHFDSLSATSEQLLTPGQLLIYDAAKKTGRVMAENLSDIGAWTDGKLLFHQVPLREVLSQLERKYHVVYHYPSTLKNELVTARFDNPSLTLVMEHLSFGWDIRYTKQGDTIYIK